MSGFGVQLYRPGDAKVADLLLEQGRIAAQRAAASGQIWGGALQNVGQVAGQAIQQHAEQSQLKKQDQAFMDLLQRSEGTPDPKQVLGIYGPQRGMHIVEGLAALDQVSQKRGVEALQHAPAVLRGYEALSPEMRAMAWPKIRQTAIAAGLSDGSLPEQRSDELDAQVISWGKGLSGPKEAPKTREVKVRNADGSESIQIVEDKAGQNFTSAAAPTPKHMVTVPGPNGPVQRLATEEELAAGVPSFREPRQPQAPVAVMGPDGKPVFVAPGQAYGMRPASNREQGRPVTSGDAGKISEFDTSLDDLNKLTTAVTGSKATGTAARVGAAMPNWVTEATGVGAEAKSKQAVIDRVKQVIGKALEGGVLRKEDEYKYEKILPIISDVPQVVEAKLDGLWKAIQLRRQTHLDALSDAGYDVTKYEARAPRERVGAAPAATPAPSATPLTVTAPNGKVYTFPSKMQAEAFRKRTGIK